MILDNIKLPISYTKEDLETAVRKALGKRKVKIHSLRLLRRSIDARKKPDLFYVCKVAVNEPAGKMHIPKIEKPLKVVVAGSGPCGLFAALILSLSGASVTVLERGDDADTRKQKTEHFFVTGELDPESNIQFGEGGAGTFSDGKLNTLIKDSQHFGAFVLQTFYECGAPEEILYDAKPHIGTDVLVHVVESIRKEILSLGGEVRFGTKLTGLQLDDGSLRGAAVQDENGNSLLSCRQMILAIGHSARDTFETLLEQGVPMERKPFAMGVRIEHRQADIDFAQYGKSRGTLPPADYSLHVHLPDGTGVFSFCMCPGGQVFAAASESGGVVTNGMSYAARDGKNANAALLVGLKPEDFPGEGVLAGMFWQRELEQAAFHCGGGNYLAPAQKVGDFLQAAGLSADAGHISGSVDPSYRPGVICSDLYGLLPRHIAASLAAAIPLFGKQLSGFDNPEAVLTGPETRSSSPVRILRGKDLSSAIRGLYPCGEGAGYAGGITSAAVDGMRCAEAVIAAVFSASAGVASSSDY